MFVKISLVIEKIGCSINLIIAYSARKEKIRLDL